MVQAPVGYQGIPGPVLHVGNVQRHPLTLSVDDCHSHALSALYCRADGDVE
jgi:hypothetical protein